MFLIYLTFLKLKRGRKNKMGRILDLMFSESWGDYQKTRTLKKVRNKLDEIDFKNLSESKLKRIQEILEEE